MTLSTKVGLTPELLIQLFPFHFVINRQLEIVQYGNLLPRICLEIEAGKKFSDYLQITRPQIPPDFNIIQKRVQRSRCLFLIKSLSQPIQLKGEIIALEDSDLMLFVGSPWITDLDALKPLGLKLKDFSVHDPICDYLLILQNKATLLAELEQTNQTLENKLEELRIAEENYRSIFENALEGIFQATPDGKFISVNPAMAKLYGYSSPQEMIRDVNNIHQQNKWYCSLKPSSEIKNCQYQVSRKDGSIIWVEESARTVYDSEGKILHYEGIVQNITERKQLEESLKHQVNLVCQMQQMILPKVEELEGIEGLDLAGFMKPAEEVGGDYYDVLHQDGVVTLGIGDVTGHGLESGILMVMTQTAVRTLKEIGETDPVRFLSTLNRTIYQNVQRMNSDKSLTLGILHYYQGQVSISGQHEEVLLVRSGGKIQRIDTIDLGLPIGLDDTIDHFIDQITVELESGDGIVLYTDGITEAKDINKKFYGLERLCLVVSQVWQKSAQQIQEAVIEDVYDHIGTQKVFDDITLLVLKKQ